MKEVGIGVRTAVGLGDLCERWMDEWMFIYIKALSSKHSRPLSTCHILKSQVLHTAAQSGKAIPQSLFARSCHSRFLAMASVYLLTSKALSLVLGTLISFSLCAHRYAVHPPHAYVSICRARHVASTASAGPAAVGDVPAACPQPSTPLH